MPTRPGRTKRGRPDSSETSARASRKSTRATRSSKKAAATLKQNDTNPEDLPCNKQIAKAPEEADDSLAGQPVSAHEEISTYTNRPQQDDKSSNILTREEGSDIIKALEEQVATLKRQVQVQEECLRDCREKRCFLENKWWSGYDGENRHPEHFPELYRGSFYELHCWIQVFGVDTLSHLSTEQKDNVVKSLNGYLVQDSLDSIVARLHPALRNFPKSLTTMFLTKWFMENIFQNPFWDMDESLYPSGSATTRPPVVSGATSTGHALNTLYSWFQQVSDEYAHTWRIATVRLYNSLRRNRSASHHDNRFSLATKTHRAAMCTTAASHLLADKTFSYLWKSTEQQGKADDNWPVKMLADALQSVAEAAVPMHNLTSIIEVRTLKGPDGIKGPFFNDSDIMDVEYELDDSPNGLEVLGITRPYICQRLLFPDVRKDVGLICKANALVAKAESTEEE
ncbi:hypothetical protein BJX70DRAFT_402423 [Aspergillus crustosus]